MVWVKWKIHLLRTHFCPSSQSKQPIYIKYKLIWFPYRMENFERGRNKAFSYPLLLSYIKTFSDTKTLKYRMRCIEEGFVIYVKYYTLKHPLVDISSWCSSSIYLYIYKICIFLPSELIPNLLLFSNLLILLLLSVFLLLFV